MDEAGEQLPSQPLKMDKSPISDGNLISMEFDSDGNLISIRI